MENYNIVSVDYSSYVAIEDSESMDFENKIGVPHNEVTYLRAHIGFEYVLGGKCFAGTCYTDVIKLGTVVYDYVDDGQIKAVTRIPGDEMPTQFELDELYDSVVSLEYNQILIQSMRDSYSQRYLSEVGTGTELPKTYLTFRSPNEFTLKVSNESANWDGTIEYSVNGVIWSVWDGTEINSSTGNNAGLFLRGIGNTYVTGASGITRKFILTGSDISITGNIEYLLDYETVLEGGHPRTDDACYQNLFKDNSGIVSVDKDLLPNTYLMSYAYTGMFSGCTNLTNIPDLPASQLTDYCYTDMFNGCTSIKVSDTQTSDYQIPYRIPSVATGQGALDATAGMFANTGGTFTSDPNINTTYYLYGQGDCTVTWVNYDDTVLATQSYLEGSIPVYPNATPTRPDTSTHSYMFSRWIPTITPVESNITYKAEYIEIEITYLTFRSPNSFTLKTANETANWNGTLEYSSDKSNWNTWDGTEISSGLVGGNNDLYLRGTGNSRIAGNSIESRFSFSGSAISVIGNIEYLLDYLTVLSGSHPTMNSNCYFSLFYSQPIVSIPRLPSTDLSHGCYSQMFGNCTLLTSVPADLLPATTLSIGCYSYMFSGCTSLTSVPFSLLPATSLTTDCYRYMFFGCTSLTNVPNLSATTLSGISCCDHMFMGCTSLATVPSDLLPATTLSIGCYSYMFSGCTSLNSVPNLPATKLVSSCYSYMFQGCTSLTNAPNLPATTLADNCYRYMFQGCTSLTTVPNLPATTLNRYCYQSMFRGCTSLTSVPNLPATTLADGCYYQMFDGCTSLTSVPNLPATTLNSYCYQRMFWGCTSLTNVSVDLLPATTLASYCYGSMFNGCTSLTNIPNLPATTLASDCYNSMFCRCTGLASIPSNLLPATTLAGSCYNSMFWECTSLVNAPNLPATTLDSSCYNSMFYGCTSLASIPALPATTLADRCYYRMFRYCTSLTSLTDLPATTLANECYREMFYLSSSIKLSVTQTSDYQIPYRIPVTGTGVDATDALTDMFTYTGGTFTGTPTINTTYYLYGQLSVTPYLTFRSPNSFTLEFSEGQLWNGTLEYSTDTTSWIEWDGSEVSSGLVNDSNDLYLRGTDNTYIIGDELGIGFALTGSNISVIGNIENLLDYQTVLNGEHPIMGNWCFCELFHGASSIVSVDENLLPSESLSEGCYAHLFHNCTSLVTVPRLPATTVDNYSYYEMFAGCTSLTTLPANWLIAETLGFYSYGLMFSMCTNLIMLPLLPATTLSGTGYSEGSYYAMFQECTKIKLSTTQTGEYQTPYRIPSSGWADGTDADATSMFINTGGTFTGPIELHVTYYTSNTVV